MKLKISELIFHFLKNFFFVAAFVLLAASVLFFNPHFASAQVISSATASIDSATVSGTTLTVTGTAQGPLSTQGIQCPINLLNPPGPANDIEALKLVGGVVTYSITGGSSGNVPLLGPGGQAGINQPCNHSSPVAQPWEYVFGTPTSNFFTVDVSGLSAGTHTITITIDDGESPSPSDSYDFTIVPTLPVPLVSINADLTNVTVNTIAPKLTWSATNSPSSCIAWGDWGGTPPVIGNSVPQAVPTSIRIYTYTLECINATGNSLPASATVNVIAPVPTVLSPTATSITDTTAKLGANVTSDGGAPVVSRGVCWGLTAYPSGSCAPEGGAGTGIFTETLSGFVANTTFYYRGYATNSSGTGYSSDGTFTTLGTPLPDLTAGASSPIVATALTPLTFSAIITNQGNASTGASFYNDFQVDTVPNGGVSGTISNLTAISMPTLAANGTDTATSPSYTFPSAGTYSVRACADKNNLFAGTITESNEANNCGSWTNVTVSPANNPQLPDLIASVPSTIANTSTNVTFTSKITNIGDASTGSGFYNFFQVSSAANGGGANTDLTPTLMGALDAETSDTATSPSYTFTSGTYSVRACADKSSSGDAGTIAESNENNNCSGWTNVTIDASGKLIFSTAPDLTAGISSPITATVNTPLTFSGTITNSGNASTGSSFYNDFQIAGAANGGGGTSNLAAVLMSALDAGAINTATSPSYTFSSQGTYSVRVCADENASMVGTISESDESNNCGAWTNVIVSAGNSPGSATADIKANGSDGPITIDSGKTVHIIWTSSNATSCTVTPPNWSGTSGDQTLNLSATTVYQIYCTPPDLPHAENDEVTVNIGSSTFGLNVIKSGQGSVTSDPSGIDCGDTCQANYPVDAQVKLTETPPGQNQSHLFTGWGGDCASSGTNSSCTLIMDSSKSVIANFIVNPNYGEF